MNFCAAALCFASHGEWRYRNTQAEFYLMNETIPTNGKLQPFRQSVHHGHAHAMQTTGYLVGIVIEFPAGMKFGHDDLGGGTLEFVIVFDASGYAPPVILDSH